VVAAPVAWRVVRLEGMPEEVAAPGAPLGGTAAMEAAAAEVEMQVEVEAAAAAWVAGKVGVAWVVGGEGVA